MIGSGLKKFATENGMKVSQGVAYGDFHGYAATFCEGSGWKLIAITTKFTDDARKYELQGRLNSQDLKKEYRVLALNFLDDGILIRFHDTVGTMARIRAFTDYLLPLLAEYGALGVDHCTECGVAFAGDGQWKLINGVAFHIHEGCAQSVQRAAESEAAQLREEDTGTYAKGLLGAFLGTLVGAIVWALVLYLGYIASVVGLLIGWLAKKGYELLHGKSGKGKVLIVILMGILGVVIGTFASEAFTLVVMISGGELPGWTYGDIPATILYLLETNSEYASAVLGNMAMGLLFALLGMYGVFKELRSETKGFQMTNLE